MAHKEIDAHNDLCDLVNAPQHLYAGEELDLTVCFNRRRFEELKAQLNAFINKETPRYFVTKISNDQIISKEDVAYFRAIALRPTIASIIEEIHDAGYDARNHFAARRVLAARNLAYWEEFIPHAKVSDWLIWAAEDVSAFSKREMMTYHKEAMSK